MDSITNAYINALLADATYALKEIEEANFNGSSLSEKLKTRMTPTQAKFIADNFSIVSYCDTSDDPLYSYIIKNYHQQAKQYK